MKKQYPVHKLLSKIERYHYEMGQGISNLESNLEKNRRNYEELEVLIASLRQALTGTNKGTKMSSGDEQNGGGLII